MDDLLSEKEQIEQIRTWWSEYGNYVIGGVLAGAIGLFGYNYYQNSQMNARLEASALYESLTNYVVSGDLERAVSTTSQLETEYGSTVYASQAKLAMGRLYMDRNRDQDAVDVLRALIDSDAGEELKDVARARVARILLYQDKAQDAVDLLEGRDSVAFGAIFSELLGDAYHALGRIEDAEAAYRSALMNPMAQSTIDQEFVQWKVLDLPQTAVAAEPSEEPAVEAAEPGTEEGE
ncbi:MAG TPA: tetratricopeptide repeat protein [Woeseiaceae bacterium]